LTWITHHLTHQSEKKTETSLKYLAGNRRRSANGFTLSAQLSCRLAVAFSTIDNSNTGQQIMRIEIAAPQFPDPGAHKTLSAVICSRPVEMQGARTFSARA